MKILTGTLFVIGIYYALFAWMLIPVPIGIFTHHYDYKLHDVIVSLGGSMTSLVGYFVWIGWGYLTFKGTPLLVTRKKFWTISLLQHTACLFVLPAFYDEGVWSFMFSNMLLGFWILTNIVIALMFIFWRESIEQNHRVDTTTTSTPR